MKHIREVSKIQKLEDSIRKKRNFFAAGYLVGLIGILSSTPSLTNEKIDRLSWYFPEEKERVLAGMSYDVFWGSVAIAGICLIPFNKYHGRLKNLEHRQ